MSSYIEQFEQELISKLNGNEDNAAVVRWVAEKVLESYRNGITAGQKGATVKRQGQSRRRGVFGNGASPPHSCRCPTNTRLSGSIQANPYSARSARRVWSSFTRYDDIRLVRIVMVIEACLEKTKCATHYIAFRALLFSTDCRLAIASAFFKTTVISQVTATQTKIRPE